jgi:hypothetical protein
MDILRDGFDGLYNLIKPIVFKATSDNAKIAHRLFVSSLGSLCDFGLARLVLDNEKNHIKGPYVISNVAGFVKDAELFC